jgi:hypothetical protein
MAKRILVVWALAAALAAVTAGWDRGASAHAADLYTDGSSGGPGSLAIVVVVGGVAAAGYALYRRQAPARRKAALPRRERFDERLVDRPTGGNSTRPAAHRGRQGSRARTRHRARRW